MAEQKETPESLNAQVRDVPPPIQTALELSGSPILFLSVHDLRILSANPAALEFLKVSKSQLDELSLRHFVPERDAAKFDQLIESIRSKRVHHSAVYISAGDGIGLARMALQRVGDVLVLADQTQSQDLARGSQVVTEKDPLTGLMNRRVFEHRLQLAIDRDDVHWGILFIDLNDYKQVNDLHGHLAGDSVLVEFARKLTASVRPGDVAARFGGDEFVVLVDRIPSNVELRLMADRLADELFVHVDGRPVINVTASIGCAMATADLMTIQEIISAADRDMYRVKRNIAR